MYAFIKNKGAKLDVLAPVSCRVLNAKDIGSASGVHDYDIRIAKAC
jgi:hypothetical protein